MKHLVRTVITVAAAGGLRSGSVAVAQDMTEPTELPYDTPEECEANGGTFALFMGCRDAEEYAAFLESLAGPAAVHGLRASVAMTLSYPPLPGTTL